MKEPFRAWNPLCSSGPVWHEVVLRPRDDCSKMEQLGVTFTAGFTAGVFCAVVSQPADTIVSFMNQAEGSSAAEAARALGTAVIPSFVQSGALSDF